MESTRSLHASTRLCTPLPSHPPKQPRENHITFAMQRVKAFFWEKCLAKLFWVTASARVPSRPSFTQQLSLQFASFFHLLSLSLTSLTCSLTVVYLCLAFRLPFLLAFCRPQAEFVQLATCNVQHEAIYPHALLFQLPCLLSLSQIAFVSRG